VAGRWRWGGGAELDGGGGWRMVVGVAAGCYSLQLGGGGQESQEQRRRPGKNKRSWDETVAVGLGSEVYGLAAELGLVDHFYSPGSWA
jgi:hypothetical protein